MLSLKKTILFSICPELNTSRLFYRPLLSEVILPSESHFSDNLYAQIDFFLGILP